MADGLDWVLQIAENAELVAWWYGTPENYYTHDLYTRMNGVHTAVADWKFSLPEVPVGVDAPVELDRATGVLWRFNSVDGIHPCGWHIAPTREAALEAARAFAQEQYVLSGGWKNRSLLDAVEGNVQDVRIPKTFQDFMAAVTARRSASQA